MWLLLGVPPIGPGADGVPPKADVRRDSVGHASAVKARPGVLTHPSRPAILLYPIGSAVATAPAHAVVQSLTRRLAEALRRAGIADVTVLHGAPKLPPATDAGFTPSSESVRAARSARAAYLLYGALVALEEPQNTQAGRAVLRLALVETSKEGLRSLEVETSVGRRARADPVAAALARAAAEAIRRDWLPTLKVGAVAPESLVERLRRARDALQEGDLAEATRLLEEAAREAPRDPRVCSALGDLHVRTGRLASAIAHYREAILFDPTDMPTRLRLLQVLEEHGDRRELARQARAVRAAGHEAAAVWRALALGALAEGHAAEAEEAITQALARDPTDGAIQRARAFLLAATGRARTAAQLLEWRVKESGDPDLIGLLARVRTLPDDSRAALEARFPAPGWLMDSSWFQNARDAARDRAWELAAADRTLGVHPGPGESTETRQQQTLARSAEAHALVAYWSRCRPAVGPGEEHDALASALEALARAALARAVAEDRPWPGGRAFATQLREEAERLLGSEAKRPAQLAGVVQVGNGWGGRWFCLACCSF